MELSDVTRKIHAFFAIAEHPNTSEAEADAARQKAMGLMFKFQIEEAMLDESRPATERMKPEHIDLLISQDYHDLIYDVARLAQEIARHCRCRAFWPPTGYTRTRGERGFWMIVAGYKSDLSFFQVLYAQIHLHMIAVFFPKIDSTKSMGENAYMLHGLGKNWLQIAEMYGWRKAHNSELTMEQISSPYQMYIDDNGDIQPATQVGSRVKRAYHKYAKDNDLPIKIVQASHSRQGENHDFRSDAAYGYTDRLGQRLARARREEVTSGALELRRDSLQEYLELLFPQIFKVDPVPVAAAGKPVKMPKIKYRTINERAYSAGVDHANSADLNTGMPGHNPGQIGGSSAATER